jgi:hypothetical protein
VMCCVMLCSFVLYYDALSRVVLCCAVLVLCSVVMC